ncbi:MAG: 2OG-Fe dioxygenase family protein [bacterium]|nr:2OG-Fe dioxygenase family protein [bacterium]
MEEILLGLGATPEDIEALRTASENLAADPTLRFRESRNGRFCFDYEQNRLQRLEFQPFILTKDEDFVRHDSGKVREFRGIQDDLQLNTGFQALMRFQAAVTRDIDVQRRPKLDYDSQQRVSTVFHLRTITTPKLVGEPAAEGVHSDGVDHTMTTLLGLDNITGDSAVTHVHDPRQKNGLRWDEVDEDLVLGRHQHRHFLDTLLIVDHELKHTVTPVGAEDPKSRATRDMLILFTRHPTTEEHASHPYDSLIPHNEIPLDIQLLEGDGHGDDRRSDETGHPRRRSA